MPPSEPESDAPEAEEAVQTLAGHLFRRESARMVSILTGILGTHRLQMAEDAVQEALIRAMQRWPYSGIPEQPAAWLLSVAKNRALDQVRRERNFQRKQPGMRADFERLLGGGEPDFFDKDGDEISDDQLRLMFVCCHPALPPEARTALALKTLCGFSPNEIARAFLVSEAAIAKRLTRARQKLRDSGVAFEIPSGNQLPDRIDGVREILYLLFNEGHKATSGEEAVRAELCEEAIRLGRQLVAHPVGNEPATHALLALMLLTAARIPARTDAEGNLLRLEEQDRSRWDRKLISDGMRHLGVSAVGENLSAYHLQAAIAACHTLANDDASTDWERILALYDQLLAHHPSPVVALNRAVALSRVEGPAAGIAAVQRAGEVAKMEYYHLYHAVLGELEQKRGHHRAAAGHFREALELAETRPERELLARRLEACFEFSEKEDHSMYSATDTDHSHNTIPHEL